MKQFVNRNASPGFAAPVVAAVCIAAFTEALALAQVPPPPGPAGPVPPPPPPAAPMPSTGAASGDILQGVNPDVQGEVNVAESVNAPAGEARVAASDRSAATADAAESTADTDAEEAADVDADAEAAKASARRNNEEQEVRTRQLRNSSSLRGSTGLFRTHSASSGPVGSLRFGLLTSYMSSTGFLCPQCEAVDGGDPAREDDVSRVGWHVEVGATVLPFLEAYLGVHSTATRNSLGRPVLLQTQADTTWGLKAFMPHSADRVYSAGGALELWMLNGPGGVGIDTASAAVRLLGTADYTNRINPKNRLPLKVHFNLSYIFDNSGSLVEAEEQERGERLTRIERFGLNVSRVDQLVPAIGVEGVFKYVNPFIEWSVDIPANRQDYACSTAELNASDVCLDSYGAFDAAPARLTVGARGFVLLDGLSVFGALDVATGGVNSPFWEEMMPEPPWNLHLGLAFAVDTKPRVVEKVIALKPKFKPTPENLIQGVVVEEGTADVPVPNAVVRYDGVALTGMITDDNGRFETRSLPYGEYRFVVLANGYEPGLCVSKIAAPKGRSSTQSEGNPQPNLTRVVCHVKAKPKMGNIEGAALAATAGTPIADAKVTVTDKLGRSLSLQADQAGAFRFENVPPGEARVQLVAPGYLTTSKWVSVPPGQDFKITVELTPTPVPANVLLNGKQIVIRKALAFQAGTKELLPEANALLDELATLLLAHPELERVEIQSHTSSENAAVVGMQLSQQRAELIQRQLVDRGIPASRLQAQGYGDSQPIAPNSTEFGRKKNERVVFVVAP
jgi:outer membrane protein OmpA-like peptidoglycan-associated protein